MENSIEKRQLKCLIDVTIPREAKRISIISSSKLAQLPFSEGLESSPFVTDSKDQ
jgi:hypothetical protein